MDDNECDPDDNDEDYNDCMDAYLENNCDVECADEPTTDERSEDDDGNDSQTRSTH